MPRARKRARLDCDFHRNTAEALPELIRQLRAGGYRVVRMVPKGEVTTVPKYDEMVRQQDKLSQRAFLGHIHERSNSKLLSARNFPNAKRAGEADIF